VMDHNVMLVGDSQVLIVSKDAIDEVIDLGNARLKQAELESCMTA
jgi:hypothetical protein